MASIDFIVTQTLNPLPPPFSYIVKGFGSVHKIWRWFRLGKIYSNKENFLSLAGGYVTPLAIGDSTIFKVSAMSVLIATRIMDSLNAQTSLNENIEHLSHSLNNIYPQPIKIAWEKKVKHSFFSTSTLSRWKFKLKNTRAKINRILKFFLYVLRDSFELSMRITDTAEAFSFSPEVQKESKNLVFINGSRCIQSLMNQSDILLDQLKKNKYIIERILKSINSTYTADQLIKVVRNSITNVSNAHDKITNISTASNNFFVNLGKKYTYELFYTIGMHDMLPDYVLPPKSLPSRITYSNPIQNSFPTIVTLTKPSMAGNFRENKYRIPYQLQKDKHIFKKAEKYILN